MVNDAKNILSEICVVIAQVFKSILIAMFHAVIKSPPEKCVNGQIALITGGGSGIGRLLAIDLAKRGATVISWDVDTSGNEETVRLVKAAAPEARCHAYTVDVSKRHLVEEYAKQVHSEVGNVSILINNAAIVTGKTILDATDESIHRTFEVNLFSQFWTIKEFLPHMLELKHAHIVNISSMLCFEALAGVSDYAGSKAAVARLAESLDAELTNMGAFHIKTTAVFPYYINTKLFAGCRISNNGHLVTIATLAGVIGASKLSDYCSANFGQVGFNEAVDQEMAFSEHIVHTTIVCAYMLKDRSKFDHNTNRFPWLLPPLDPQQAANRTMKAILTNQKVLYMPRLFYFLIALKSVLPVEAALILHKFIGSANFMDTYVGQEKED